MAFQPFEDHLPQLKLPRPTRADYEKRKKLEERDKDGWSDELVDLMNAFDWTTRSFGKGKKWGLKNPLGEVILEPGYENFMMLTPSDLKTGDRVVAMKNGLWGVLLIDGPGTWLIEPEYDYIGYPNDITHVRKGNKWGVLNLDKKEFLIPLECDHIDSDKGFMFINGIGAYERDGKCGIITHYGAFTEAIFDEAELIPEEWVKVKFEGQWGYLDEELKFTLDEDEAGLHLGID